MIRPLTSLRIIFAIMVFFSHIQFGPQTPAFFASLYESVFMEGYIGVSFFFILSGFVLSLSYKGKLHSQITLGKYMLARVARIYPLHVLTLIIATPLMMYDLAQSATVFFEKFATNLLLLHSWIPDKAFYFSFNAPSWSISDELFFYLMFPFLLLLFRFKNVTYLFFLMLLIPILIYLAPEAIEHKVFYINPLLRIFDFILGMLLYQLYEKGVLKPRTAKTATLREFLAIGLFLLFFSLHAYIPQGYRYSCYYWIPMALAILMFSYSSGYISIILSKGWLVKAGEISFAFYMLHQLVIRYISIIEGKLHLINNYYLLILIMFIISIVASYLSYVFFEMPINRYVKKINFKTKQPVAIYNRK